MRSLRPTARGWGAMAAAVGAFAISLVNASLGVSLLAAGCLALTVSSFAMALLAARGLQVRREPGADGVIGHALALPVTVTNTTRWHRQSVVLREVVSFTPDGEVVLMIPPLAPRESRYLRRPTPVNRRGEFHLNDITLLSGDPAGLFVRAETFSFPHEVLVYPKITRVPNLPLRLRDRVTPSALGQPIGLSGQGQDFFGVREYRPTDGIRFIHWRASARQRKLMVREFEENTVNQVSILLDVDDQYVSGDEVESNFEYQIQVAASIIEHLAAMYCRCLFCCGPRATQQVRLGFSQAIHQQVMHSLALLRPQRTGILSQLQECHTLIPPNSILYCLTLHEPKGLEEAFERMLKQGVDVRWIHAPRALFLPGKAAESVAAVSRFAADRRWLVPPRIVSPHLPLGRVLADE